MKKMRLSVLAALTLVVGVLGLSATPADAVNPNVCVGTQQNKTLDELIVRSGDVCVLKDSTVYGAARVETNASLETCNDHFGGSLTVNHGYIKIDHLTTIDGQVNVVPQAGISGVDGVCGMSQGAASYSGIFCPELVQGPFSVKNAPSGNTFDIGDCGYIHFMGPVTIVGNQVPVTISNSTIDGDLTCRNNTPAAVQEGGVTVEGTTVGCPYVP